MNCYKIFKSIQDPLLRLVCFHYAGGSASIYKKWSQDLPQNVELIAAQLPGREDRFNEALIYDIQEIVDEQVSNFDIYRSVPYVFFGHSLGALIAFEMTRALKKQNMDQPLHLIVSGARAPHKFTERNYTHDLADDEFIQELKKYNQIPKIIYENTDFMDFFLPMLRADFCVSESYNYEMAQPLDCPITALGGLSDHTMDRDYLLEWKTQTSNLFKSHFLDGDHMFLNSSYSRVIQLVNSVLTSYLMKADHCVFEH